MPRKKKTEKPDIYADAFAVMSPPEKQAIRDMLVNPAWVKFMRVVACKKPSVFAAGLHGTGVDDTSATRSIIKLSEIRGWELYERAIYLALNEPVARRQETEPTYPDAARIDRAEPLNVNTK